MENPSAGVLSTMSDYSVIQLTANLPVIGDSVISDLGTITTIRYQ